MTKRALLFFVAFAIVVPMVYANPISEQQALEIVRQYSVKKSSLRSVHEVKSQELSIAYVAKSEDLQSNLLYAVNRGEGNGYMFVAADDIVGTLVLGYTDSGKFDYANAPENLKWWLSEYGRLIEYAIENNLTTAQAPSFDTAVGPLVTTKWNQGWPFNNMCPEDEGGRSVTGCVATAMAQVMNYHEWPKQGIGSHSYDWYGTTLSVDFSQSTYDWDNMLDVYDEYSGEEACNAVATLMYHCGVAAEMDYSSSASGAYSAQALKALIDNFGYGADAVYEKRNYYEYSDWIEKLKSELDAGRPLYYDGSSLTGAHAFVIDGYNTDGLFHVNWGWGGVSDGYYVIATLNPSRQGIGGSDGGYSYAQGAFFNLDPADGTETSQLLMYVDSTYLKETEDSEEVNELVTTKGTDFIFGAKGLWNQCPFDLIAYYGATLEDAEGNVLETYVQYPFNLPVGYGYIDVPLTLQVPTHIADGTYRIYLGLFDDDLVLTTKLTQISSGPKYGAVIVNGDEVTISLVDTEIVTFPDVSCSNIEISTNPDFTNGEVTRVFATLTNNSESNYNSSVCFVLCEQGTQNIVYPQPGSLYPMITVALRPGETVTMDMEQQISGFEPGSQTQFDIYIYDNIYEALLPVGTTINIDVVDKTPQLQVNHYDYINRNPSELTFVVNFTNNSETDFDGTCFAQLYDFNWNFLGLFDVHNETLAAGQSGYFTYSGSVPVTDVIGNVYYFNIVTGAQSHGYIVYDLSGLSYITLSSSNILNSEPENLSVAATFATIGNYAPYSGDVTASVMRVTTDASGEEQYEEVLALGSQSVTIDAGGETEVTYSGSLSGYDKNETYVILFQENVHNTVVGKIDYKHDTTTGINDVTVSGTRIYPNPVKDVVKIEAASTIEAVRVYSLAGSQVIAVEGNEGNAMQMDMSELQAGTYIVRIVTVDGTKVCKVVKR